MAIFSLPQYENETFWRYFHRVNDYIGYNYGHRLLKVDICEVIFEGLNDEMRVVVESMSEGQYMSKTINENWSMFEWLAKDTYDWEMASHETYDHFNDANSFEECGDNVLDSNVSSFGDANCQNSPNFFLDSNFMSCTPYDVANVHNVDTSSQCDFRNFSHPQEPKSSLELALERFLEGCEEFRNLMDINNTCTSMNHYSEASRVQMNENENFEKPLLEKPLFDDPIFPNIINLHNEPNVPLIMNDDKVDDCLLNSTNDIGLLKSKCNVDGILQFDYIDDYSRGADDNY